MKLARRIALIVSLCAGLASAESVAWANFSWVQTSNPPGPANFSLTPWLIAPNGAGGLVVSKPDGIYTFDPFGGWSFTSNYVPLAIASDRFGDLYILDKNHHVLIFDGFSNIPGLPPGFNWGALLAEGVA